MTDEKQILVEGDFARLFEPSEMNALINTPDEVSCVLRSQIILEEFVSLYVEKVTNSAAIFDDGFIGFNTKIQIARNLGFHSGYADVIDRVNKMRNRFAHRRGYTLAPSELEALADKIDALKSHYKMESCRKFHVEIEGVNPNNRERKTLRYVWGDADGRIKFLLLFSVLMWKLIYWIQTDLAKKGIAYSLADEIQGGALDT